MAHRGARRAGSTGGGTVTRTVASNSRARIAYAVLGLPFAWFLLDRLLPSGLPLGVVLQGVVLGSLTGLSALGLVLVHRSSRVVNFAQAALGSAAALLAIQLFQVKGWNYYLAFATGLVVAAAVGALCDRLVVQRLFWAPRLILTVATIGLAQVLAGLSLGIPSLIGGGGGLGGLQSSFRVPLDVEFSFGALIFNGGHVMVLIVVPLVLVIFAIFLRRSAFGVGIRATSANAERAMLLGIPVRRLSTVVWALAGVLSALSAMLAAPLVGQGGELTAGPALLCRRWPRRSSRGWRACPSPCSLASASASSSRQSSGTPRDRAMSTSACWLPCSSPCSPNASDSLG